MARSVDLGGAFEREDAEIARDKLAADVEPCLAAAPHQQRDACKLRKCDLLAGRRLGAHRARVTANVLRHHRIHFPGPSRTSVAVPDTG